MQDEAFSTFQRFKPKAFPMFHRDENETGKKLKASLKGIELDSSGSDFSLENSILSDFSKSISKVFLNPTVNIFDKAFNWDLKTPKGAQLVKIIIRKGLKPCSFPNS